ncbi:hypothetical protein AB0F17_08275 [Nonomuraea sp. NPDC026600]|uniref:hypothetical protein n=1 Tax=Nonomuraea sp. NPDC026600 TaxID=3155363 RepID=UPI0033DDD848
MRLRISEFEVGANGVKKNLTGLNKKFAETAGFAAGFRKKLEDATKKLPKIEIDADSTPAEVKLAELRAKLEKLSGKEIGVDIDASQALVEMAALQHELEGIGDGALFEVRADIGNALADLNAVTREVQRLDGQKVEIDIEADRTFADKLRAQVEGAARSLPKIQVDADSTPAQIKIAELREKLVSLADKKIGVDLDSAAALAEIAAIERELNALAKSTDIDVRVDSGSALAELRAITGEVDRVNGRSARVNINADVGGALTAIALVGAALASLPAVTTVAVGVGALGAAFTAAGVGAAGFAAVAVPSMGRINDALKQQASAAGGAGGATKSAGQSAAEAASRALQLEQAERRVSDAQKAVKASQEDLTRARQDAKRALEDLTLSVKDSALAEEDAALSVEEARQRLAEVQADPKATELERKRAELNYREAVQRLEDQGVRTKRLQEDKAKADKAGVEGSDQVRSAQDKLLRSQKDLVEAQKQLVVTQLQQKAAMQQAGGAAGGAASKFAELSKAEQALAKDVKKFQDSYVAWQRSLQPDVFPAIRSGMDLMSTGMKLSTPLVKASAGAINDLLKQANQELKSEQWRSFFDDLTEQAPKAIRGLGDAALNVAGGLTGVIQAFLPYTGPLMDFLREATQRFKDWGQNLKGSPEFAAFIKYVQEQGPKVGEVLRNIAEFVGKVFEVGAGAAPGVLDFLVSLSDKLAALNPAQIEAVAKGVGLIFAAMKLGASLKIAGLLALAEVLSKMSPGQIQALAVAIAAVVGAVKGYQIFQTVAGFLGGFSSKVGAAGDAAGAASGKFSLLSGVFKGGVIAAAVLGSVAAFDKMTDSLSGLNPNVDDLSKNLLAFGKGGEPASALLDQLGPKIGGVVGAFETFSDSAARLAGDNPLAKIADSFTGFIDDTFSVQLDSGRQAIDNLDQRLAAMVASGNTEGAAGAFNRLAKQALDAGVPVEKLKELFPQYAASMDGVPATTGGVGSAIELLGGKADGTQRQLGEAAKRMSDFKASIDAFNGQTDAAQAVREMEKAFSDTKSAIEAANGKLELTPGLTGKQRDAVIAARDAFAGYLEKIKASADAQATLSGRTTDARDAVLRQLPAMIELAGKNQSARDQVIELAKAYGISETDAKKAARGGQDLVEVLGKLKSKDIRVGADVKPAQDAIDNFVRLNSGRKIPLSVYTKNSQLAAGAIMRYAAGGVQRFAEGGRATPAPHIASSPTILYGEGRAPEAFIPYDPAYRDRATALLGQVAGDFGLQVFNAQAGKQVDSLTGTLKETQYNVGSSLSQATSMLSQTLGDAGTLTSTVASVGTVGEQMSATWAAGAQTVSDSVVGVNTAIGISSDMIVVSTDKVKDAALTVADVVAKAAQAILSAASASGGSGKGSKGSTNVPAPGKSKGSGKGSLGSVIPPAPGSSSSMNASNSVAGDYGLYGMTGSNPDAALMTNYSRVSAPQQQTAASISASRISSSEGVNAGGGSGSGGSGGSSVNFYGTTIHDEMDASVVAAKIGVVLDSRG